IESGDARAREQLDAVLAPPGVGAKQGLLSGLFAAQVALRAVRAVVRRVGLASDQQQLALGALLTQPARAVRRGQAAADQKIIDLAGSHRILNLRENRDPRRERSEAGRVADRPSRPRGNPRVDPPARTVFVAI